MSRDVLDALVYNAGIAGKALRTLAVRLSAKPWQVTYSINDKYHYTELIERKDAPDYWAALRVAQYRVSDVERLLGMGVDGLMRVTGITSIKEVKDDVERYMQKL